MAAELVVVERVAVAKAAVEQVVAVLAAVARAVVVRAAEALAVEVSMAGVATGAVQKAEARVALEVGATAEEERAAGLEASVAVVRRAPSRQQRANSVLSSSQDCCRNTRR